MSIKAMLEGNKNYIVKEYQKGKSTNKLANEFSCNSGHIYLLLQRCGIEIRSLGRSKLKGKEELIQTLYNQGYSACAIAKECDCEKSSILKHMKKHGMSTSHLSSQREDPLVNHADEITQAYIHGKSTCELAKEYNSAPSSIWQLLQNNEVTCRDVNIHSFDTHFLDNIGEAQAYFMGWALTDGNNRRDGFRLSICDKEIVDLFKAMFQYTGEIKNIKPKNDKCKPQYALELFGMEFANRLTELGCAPAKTYDVRWPKYIKGDLCRPFIQGCLEGDGSITKNYINFTGTKYLLAGIAGHLRKTLGIKCKWYKRHKEQNVIWMIFISGQKDIATFLHWIYGTASVYLTRKYQFYLDLLEQEKQQLIQDRVIAERDLEIIQSYKNKVSILSLSKTYNLGHKTIRRIIKTGK